MKIKIKTIKNYVDNINKSGEVSPLDNSLSKLDEIKVDFINKLQDAIKQLNYPIEVSLDILIRLKNLEKIDLST